ncbi:MAG: Rrf2 family transcriptional regulator [Chitinophagaceae bacterium]|nr:MAG: Rrf2 family transcriptional regulator [Chitinophagaceae bacterium]
MARWKTWKATCTNTSTSKTISSSRKPSSSNAASVAKRLAPSLRMLSLSCKYALRAAVFLALRSRAGGRAGIREVAEGIDANEHTTAKTLQLLVREGIIASAKGPHGGFFLEGDAGPLYLIDIVRVVDGTGLFFECGLGLHQCSELKPCPIHFTYKAAREQLHREFSSISVQSLADDLEQGRAFLKRTL